MEIHDLRNNTFFANMHLRGGGREFVVDARPSDAIAVAIRTDSPIYVAESVIQKSRHVDIGANVEDMEKLKEEKLKEFLENLSPEAFGKYKM